jgi:integrase
VRELMAKAKIPKGVNCKAGYWYAYVDGQQVYCGKGDKGKDIAIAAKFKDVARQYENKEVNAGLRVKRSELNTFKDLSNWYMTEVPSIQRAISYTRKIHSSGHLMRHLSEKKVVEINEEVQERYRDLRRDEGAAEGTIDFEIETLSAMFHLAVRRKKIPASVMPGEFIMVRKTNPRRIVTDDEFESMLVKADDWLRDVLVCAYESAMRLSEICSLTAGQVKLNIQHISGHIVDYIDLGIFDTKTKTRRTVLVSPRLKEVLQRRIEGLDDEDYVFSRNDKRIYPTIITYTMRRVCKDADIIYGDKAVNKKGERIGIVFHCFRHTRTTKWVEMGFSDEIIRRATGHKSLEAYQRYIKLDPHVVMRLVEGENKKCKNERKSLQRLMN